MNNLLSDYQCRICGSKDMRFFKANNIGKGLDASAFAITDRTYGVTGELRQCARCGFVQCVDIEHPETYYTNLEDQDYSAQEDIRSRQARDLLSLLGKAKTPGTLLDIGAACGILVHEAQLMGWTAVGIEPSRWLQHEAQRRGIPVLAGVFPHPDVQEIFDAVTLIDVIEHVRDPVGLLQAASRQLAENGLLLVTTPDRNALLPRLLGLRWWHYRVAHIGYFDRSTLTRALGKAGLEVLRWGRPGWHFGLGYLIERVCSLCALPIRRKFRALDRLVIPLNLGDSLYVIARKNTR